MAIKTEFTFDNDTYRHYLNGTLVVMHCHHYMSLVHKMAHDFADIGAEKILAESAEDSIRPMLDDYIRKNSVADRLSMGAEYYSVMGMGKMLISGSPTGGEVILTHSHVDEGWMKKFGKLDKSINHWTRGYIAAVFAAAFDKAARSYEVVEVSSIVKGDMQSKFIVTIK